MLLPEIIRMWDGPNFENPIKRAPTNERMFATNMALILKF